MIPHRQSKTTERFPPEIALPFVPIPVALLRHMTDLGIGATELAVIVVLEQHRRVMGDAVYSFRSPLAEQAGLSIDQTKRAISRLVDAGLLERRQGGSIKRERGRGPNWFVLDPLWQRIADLERTSAPQTSNDVEFVVQERPQIPQTIDPFDDLRAGLTDLRAQTRLFAVHQRSTK